MKKKLLIPVLALVLCLCLAVPAAAGGTDPWSKAYDVVQIAQYQMQGKSLLQNTTWTVQSINCARILDLNADGVPELLFAISDSGAQSRPEYYGQAGRELSVFCWDGKTMRWNSTVPQVQTDDSVSAEIAAGSDGKQYFHVKESADQDKFWGLQDGQFQYLEKLTRRFQWDWGYDWQGTWIHSETGRYHCFSETSADQTEITEAEYQRRMDLYAGGGYSTLTYSTARNDPELSATLQQITQKADKSYIATYETPSSWAKDGVDAAMRIGYVPAAIGNRYGAPITRAEFCELAVQYYERVVGITMKGTASFTDTNSPAVQKLAGCGVINGYGNGIFGPNDLLTREQAAVILSNFSEKCLNTPLSVQDNEFADSASFSSWAATQIQKVAAAGIMNGVGRGKFDPKGYYTREQSILTIERINGFVPLVKGVELTAQKSILLAGQSTKISASIQPANALNTDLTWSSSNTAVAKVDANGTVSAVAEGTVVITAKTANGTTGTLTLTIRPKNYLGLNAVLNQPLNFLYNGYSYNGTVDSVPDNPRVAGTLTVTSARWDTTRSYLSPQIEISGEILSRSNLYSGVTPYYKWKLYDEDGTLVDSGMESLYVSKDTFTDSVSVSESKLQYGHDYTLVFINDWGATPDEVLDTAPTILARNVPYQLEDTPYHAQTGYATIEGVSMIVKSYSAYRDEFDVTLFFIGSAVLPEDKYYSFSFKYHIQDSDGNEVAKGSAYISGGSSYFSDSDIDTTTGRFYKGLSLYESLEAGQTYYVSFSER